MKTKDENGNEIEVFTAEELQAQKDEAIKAATGDLQSKLTEAEQKLATLSDKDANFAELRKKSQEEIEAIRTQLTEETTKIRSEFEQKEINRSTEATIKQLAEGDSELEKKIKGHLDTTLKDMQAKTPEEVANKIRAAYQLATANEPKPGLLDSVLSGAGGGGMPTTPESGPALAPELAQLAKKTAEAGGIQISDNDLKKYNKTVEDKYKLNSYGK